MHGTRVTSFLAGGMVNGSSYPAFMTCAVVLQDWYKFAFPAIIGVSNMTDPVNISTNYRKLERRSTTRNTGKDIGVNK